MFRRALNKNNSKLIQDILGARALDVYSYVYFNISQHWKDNSWKKVCLISLHDTLRPATSIFCWNICYLRFRIILHFISFILHFAISRLIISNICVSGNIFAILSTLKMPKLTFQYLSWELVRSKKCLLLVEQKSRIILATRPRKLPLYLLLRTR